MKKYARVKIENNEPVWNSSKGEEQFPKLFNWYSYNKNSEDAKKYFLEYLKYKGESAENLEKITKVNFYLPNTVGWLCRIKLIGGEELVSNKYDDRIVIEKQNIFRQLSNLQDRPKKTQESSKMGVQEYMTLQLQEYIGEIDQTIDVFLESKSKHQFDMYEWLRSHSVKSQQAKNIAEHFTSGLLSELTDAYDKVCDQLVEAYSHLKRAELKKYIEFIQKIIDDCKRWADIKKQIAKAPRIRKPKPAIKQIAKLLYLREYNNFTSIPATSIVGAKSLIVYNTKNRTATLLVCNNAHGFSVKGSTICNYDEADSFCKTIRKPDEILPELLSSGKVAARKLIEKLSTKNKKISGRINRDTLLLKAF